MGTSRLVRTATGLLGVLALTAACVAHPADAPPMLPGMTPVPVVQSGGTGDSTYALTTAQVSAALLLPSDVPADWEQQTAPATGSAGDEAVDPATTTFDPPACRDLMTAGPAATDALAADGAVYVTPDVHYVTEVVVSWAGDGSASAIDPLEAFVAGCPTFTITDAEGATAQRTLTPVAAPRLGQHAVAYTCLTEQTLADGTKVRYTTDTVAVTIGHVSIVLNVDGATPLDPALVAQLVTTATEKVQAAG